MHAPATASIIDPDLLLLAYRSGIFPMADGRDDPEIFWVEPRMRAVIPLGDLRVSRSLARTLRRGRYRVTCNAAFEQVIAACAAPRDDAPDSWISARIAASYRLLHARGEAHSVECWDGEALVGGLYGVGFGRVFCGESMFSRASDASKVALVWLVAALQRGGCVLLDCQFMTDHLASLGAVEIPQEAYVALLRDAQQEQAQPGEAEALGLGLGDAVADGEGKGAALGLPAGFAALLAEAEACGASSSPGNFIAQLFTQTS